MNSCISLDDVRPCLEGVVPSMIATVAADGTPNVAYLSQVFYVDAQHVAVSFQFFNKTRQNILAHPRATVLLLHPVTAQFYRLHLRYLRTETGGPVFERMKALLAGIASHAGMADVFVLQGSDIYEVLDVEPVPGAAQPALPGRCGMLGALRRTSSRLAQAASLDSALDTLLRCLQEELGIGHAMVLILDPNTQRLYTVASCGYATSGVGSEIALGDGVIGVAARERVPVRIMHMASAYLYGHAVRQGMADRGLVPVEVTEIPYPGLAAPHSQLAVPLISCGRTLGVLFVESPEDLRFGFEDEDLLVMLGGQLAAAIDLMREEPESPVPGEGQMEQPGVPSSTGPRLRVRHYEANNSIFLNDDYLIKGVAGAILWKLLREHQRSGRCDYSNRELRLDPDLGLPDVSDNLEARLLLLARRLQEQGRGLSIERSGRGRFRLCVAARLELVSTPD
jgi:adenylate cyclase